MTLCEACGKRIVLVQPRAEWDQPDDGVGARLAAPEPQPSCDATAGRRPVSVRVVPPAPDDPHVCALPRKSPEIPEGTFAKCGDCGRLWRLVKDLPLRRGYAPASWSWRQVWWWQWRLRRQFARWDPSQVEAPQ